MYVRVAEFEGAIYLDLANSSWQAVEITADGWRVVEEPPVRFRRSKATMPLPVPEAGGEIDELRRFVNATDEGWSLYCSWLVAALRPTGPYPVLDLVGEQGSAKSTTARIARMVTDPNKALLHSPPSDERNLMIAAANSRVLAFDNLSHIPQWLSDALCRLATGGGFAHRALYTDAEELVLEAQRPVILTAIGENFRRSDLLDRELMINLPTISEEARVPEKRFWEEFEAARPRILGALLDGVVEALRMEQTIELDTHPRMADFAVWARAAAPGSAGRETTSSPRTRVTAATRMLSPSRTRSSRLPSTRSRARAGSPVPLPSSSSSSGRRPVRTWSSGAAGRRAPDRSRRSSRSSLRTSVPKGSLSSTAARPPGKRTGSSRSVHSRTEGARAAAKVPAPQDVGRALRGGRAAY